MAAGADIYKIFATRIADVGSLTFEAPTDPTPDDPLRGRLTFTP